jgi:hypothetical protein
MTQWIKRISYNDGGRLAAGFKSSADDCVARAVSIITGRGYMWARNELNVYIARERNTDPSGVETGVWQTTYSRLLKKLGSSGFKRVKSWSQLPATGKAIVVTEEHVVAYIDGVFHDTFDPLCEKSCGKLVGYYQM